MAVGVAVGFDALAAFAVGVAAGGGVVAVVAVVAVIVAVVASVEVSTAVVAAQALNNIMARSMRQVARGMPTFLNPDLPFGDWANDAAMTDLVARYDRP